MSDGIGNRLNTLDAAVRRRAPEVTVCVCVPECCGPAAGPYVQVTYRHAGPWRVAWADDAGYVWVSGPGVGASLGAHAEVAADAIAEALGADR